MADEIVVGMSLKCTNASFLLSKSVTNKKTLQTTQGGGGPGTESVAVTEETKAMTGYGFVWIQNLDLVNYVQLGFATGVYNIRLRAGGPPLLVELEASQTLYLKANTAACNVDIVGLYL
jgi:hypothetical protein